MSTAVPVITSDQLVTRTSPPPPPLLLLPHYTLHRLRGAVLVTSWHYTTTCTTPEPAARETMGWRVTVLVVVLITGIVGQQFSLDDVKLKHNIDDPDDVPEISDWKQRCRETVGEDAVKEIEPS
ncbi:hypothetical protein OTU49_017205 [Cherax quadricarinatus]|uniref:Uncharacterized protein n=1 Tax=Cherax quadricarinatus TaxID=27406 RepID=A0AAW0Y1L5_CHEQU